MNKKLLLISLIFGSSLAFASEFAEINDYLKILEHFEKNSTTASLETVYTTGLRSAKALETKVSTMDGTKFQQLQKDMLGFNLHRTEFVSISPKYYFFIKLAKKSTNKADTVFFETQRALHDNGGAFPDYYQVITDSAHCTDFDHKAILDSYEKWLAYKKAYPKSYASEVTKEIAEVEKALLSNCVCGTKENYEKKTSQFLKLYPNLPIAEKLKKKNSKQVRFKCSPV